MSFPLKKVFHSFIWCIAINNINSSETQFEVRKYPQISIKTRLHDTDARLLDECLNGTRVSRRGIRLIHFISIKLIYYLFMIIL